MLYVIGIKLLINNLNNSIIFKKSIYIYQKESAKHEA